MWATVACFGAADLVAVESVNINCARGAGLLRRGGGIVTDFHRFLGHYEFWESGSAGLRREVLFGDWIATGVVMILWLRFGRGVFVWQE